jgi:hypothetical protein
MSRIKEQRFQAAGKEREKDWQNCERACGWGCRGCRGVGVGRGGSLEMNK